MSIVSHPALLLFLPVLLSVPVDAEMEARKIEVSLLHRQIDMKGIRVWEAHRRQWRMQPPEPAQVLVLHLWAVDCPPCVKELPLLRNITRAFRSAVPDLRFAYVTETLEEDRLMAFVRTHHEAMPDVDLYQSSDGRLRKILQTGKQPVTLLLDQNLVVRQAFVGSIAGRRNELVDSIERLLRLPREHKR